MLIENLYAEVTDYITKYIFTLLQQKLQHPLFNGIFSILKYHNGPVQNSMLDIDKILERKAPKQN